MKSEKEILVGFKAGDPASFEIIYKKCHTNVFLIALKYTKSEDEAKDIRSMCFIRLWEMRDQLVFNDFGEVVTWLTRAARNRAIDILTMVKIHIAKEDAILEKEESDNEVHVFEMGDKEAAVINRLMNRIDGLPEKFKIVFKMRWLEDLKFKEIAEKMGADLSTTKKRYARAIELIRRDTIVSAYKTINYFLMVPF